MKRILPRTNIRTVLISNLLTANSLRLSRNTYRALASAMSRHDAGQIKRLRVTVGKTNLLHFRLRYACATPLAAIRTPFLRRWYLRRIERGARRRRGRFRTCGGRHRYLEIMTGEKWKYAVVDVRGRRVGEMPASLGGLGRALVSWHCPPPELLSSIPCCFPRMRSRSAAGTSGNSGSGPHWISNLRAISLGDWPALLGNVGASGAILPDAETSLGVRLAPHDPHKHANVLARQGASATYLQR